VRRCEFHDRKEFSACSQFPPRRPRQSVEGTESNPAFSA
jgi:hypothetical protein